MPETSKDREAVRRQLGRDPKPFAVAARCPFGLPAVIENERARNMPTTFWLTCPHLDTEIARVEATGGVREAQKEVGERAIEDTHGEHLERFGVRVAGVRDGGYVKCLHAFTALHLSGAIPNPVGEWTMERIEGAYPAEGCCVLRGGKAG
ncbi:MAG: DUF501 domain-containing protein [Rubrobacter sp.]|nr:DUF501 domain-containing protein [Rubrobacter sp.]